MYRILETFPSCFGTFRVGTQSNLKNVPAETIKSWIAARVIAPVTKPTKKLSPEPT